jgi:solute carrier family 25 carnitine/acylcarnitine transporter 20/29
MAAAVKSFLAGWAGGCGILAVGHPFDTVKTRLQDMPLPKAGEAPMYTGALDCAKKTIAKEGVTGLYKGVIGPFWSMGPVFALYFVSFDQAELAIRKLTGNTGANKRNLSVPEILVCSGFTGVVGTSVCAPAELLKIRQQTALARGLDSSFGGAVKALWAEGGITKFYTGAGATMVRDVPGSMAWFGAYEIAKINLCEDPKKPTMMQALVSGGCGGLGMWCTALPLDCVKTRIQANRGSNMSWLGCAKQIASEGGVTAFYKGFVPIILRAFPANAACFACKEMAQKSLDKLF